MALLTYSDSDWKACAQSCNSVTSYFFTLGGSPISQKSKKQPTFSLSFAEAEYLTIQKVMAEISWLARLLCDFGYPISHLVSIYCDS